MTNFCKGCWNDVDDFNPVNERGFCSDCCNKKFIVKEGVLKSYASNEPVVVLPDNVRKISAEAFIGCDYITSLTLSSVKIIENFAFKNCVNLSEIVLSDSIESIGLCVFYNTKWYKNLNETLVLGNKLIKCKASEVNYVQTDDIKEIDAFAFSNSTSLKSVELTNITEIMDGTFYNCTDIEKIVLPDSLKKIGERVFYGCTSLTSIKLPSTVNFIDDSAFANCTSLVELEIPEAVTLISDAAFENCTSLKKIKLPSITTKIYHKTFFNCTALEEVVIPEKVIEIGDRVFENCHSLASVNISNDIKYLYHNTFFNCKSLKSIKLPENLLEINDKLFNGCDSLEEIVIPNTVTYIGENVFDNCANLSKLTIPDSVEFIGKNEFNNTPKITMENPRRGSNPRNDLGLVMGQCCAAPDKCTLQKDPNRKVSRRANRTAKEYFSNQE